MTIIKSTLASVKHSGAAAHARPIDQLRHVAYAGGWKKFEPLWDMILRARRVSQTLPLLESILAGFGKRDIQQRVEARRATVPDA